MVEIFELSQREGRRGASGVSMRKETKKARSNQPSTRALTAKQKRELAHLTSVRDDQIDTSEIPELHPAAWKNAVRGRFYRPVKQAVSMRLDAAVGAVICERNEAAAFAFFDCHFGDHGDACASGHHGQNRGELAALKDDVGLQAGASASGQRIFTKTVAFL